ncbi:MAG TPA: hypothetical protein DDY13_09130 [Cytophagales bacterium]|nr:hypothetical protein [Cytophagales bacterium]
MCVLARIFSGLFFPRSTNLKTYGEPQCKRPNAQLPKSLLKRFAWQFKDMKLKTVILTFGNNMFLMSLVLFPRKDSVE